MNIVLTTCNHLGDALALSAVMANAASLGEHTFFYEGRYRSVFENTPFDGECPAPDAKYYVDYRQNGKLKDNAAPAGSLIEGMTKSLALQMGIDIPCHCTRPQIVLTSAEMAWASLIPDIQGAILVNTNCQDHSTVKGWPWWRELFDLLPNDMTIILTGGQESRDVREEFDLMLPVNVQDWRGKTSVRELFAMVRVCSLVISPPSSICHVAGAAMKKQIILSGARESSRLTDYPEAVHLCSSCKGSKGVYDGNFGCMHFVTTDPRSCERVMDLDGRRYASCMARILPDAVANVARMMLDWPWEKEEMQQNGRGETNG